MKIGYKNQSFMKAMLLILFLTFAACSNPSERQTNVKDTSAIITAKHSLCTIVLDSLGTEGSREYIDSADFHIIRGKYASGAKFIEVYENKSTKLDYWTEFYETGQLKMEGTMTNPEHTLVGIWKYYSKTGLTDSVVDYDKKYPISYFAALAIAEQNGLKMPGIEITLKIEKANTYWQIARWTENENCSGQAAESILIDTKTGKVTKPDKQLIHIY